MSFASSIFLIVEGHLFGQLNSRGTVGTGHIQSAGYLVGPYFTDQSPGFRIYSGFDSGNIETEKIAVAGKERMVYSVVPVTVQAVKPL